MAAFVRALEESWAQAAVLEFAMLICSGIKRWARVKEPRGAVQLSLGRIGWIALEPFKWLTYEGDVLYVRDTCPWMVS